MAVTDLDVCSGALVMIGAEPITSFTEDTDEARACENLYTDTKKAALSAYPWRFTQAFVALSRLTDAPTAGRWSAAYQIPDTVLRIDTAWINGRRIEFDRYQDKLYCDATTSDTVTIEAHFDQDEQFWPPYFVQYMKIKMASLLAESVAAKTDLANTFYEKAAMAEREARNADAQGRTASRLDRGRITRRRFRTGSQYALGGDYY